MPNPSLPRQTGKRQSGEERRHNYEEVAQGCNLEEAMQEAESDITATEEEIIDWRTEPFEEREEEEEERPELFEVDLFTEMYGEEPTTLFEKMYWNIKKFFWSIAK